MQQTEQEEFWTGEFGREYTDRNSRDPQIWERFYLENWGVTKTKINEKLIGDLSRDIRILEVGSNTGMQLRCLQEMGFTNLYGVELQAYAVQRSREFLKNINILQGSGFDLPFKDGFFDLVCTNGVLIHIHPDDHRAFMSEMVRCTRRFIMGFEYYAPEVTALDYRGNTNYLWKADFSKIFTRTFPGLRETRRDYYKYLNSDNTDYAYLIEKNN